MTSRTKFSTRSHLCALSLLTMMMRRFGILVALGRCLGSGDVSIVDKSYLIDGYEIKERIDYLGYSKSYFKDDDSISPLLPDGTCLFESNLPVGVYGGNDALTVPGDVKKMHMNSSCIQDEFCLEHHIFRGGHGDVFRAHRVLKDGTVDTNLSFILKRMNITNRPAIEHCALREIYYGEMLRGMSDFTRYIDHFKTESDYWLVFKDEGISLQQLLYAMTIGDAAVVLKPSNVWKRFRTTSEGQTSIKGIMNQMISRVAKLHSKNIVHRDIKISNILLNTEKEPTLVLADFSSALSKSALALGLFGDDGPLQRDLTLDYAPPEVLLSNNESFSFDSEYPNSYDIWSVGVVFLELLLGTAKVFEVDQRTAALIAHRLHRHRHRHDPDFHRVYAQTMTVAALADYCIYNPEALGLNSAEGGGLGTAGGENTGSNRDSDSDSGGDADAHDGVSEHAQQRKNRNLNRHRSHNRDPEDAVLATRSRALSPPASREAPTAPTPVAGPIAISGSSRRPHFGVTISADAHKHVGDHNAQEKAIGPLRATRGPDTQEGQQWDAQSLSSSLHPVVSVKRCGLRELGNAILRRDSLGIGFNDSWGLDLLSRLLQWRPADRISMKEALGHAYFVGPYVSARDGSQHATLGDLKAHDRLVRERDMRRDPCGGGSGCEDEGEGEDGEAGTETDKMDEGQGVGGDDDVDGSDHVDDNEALNDENGQEDEAPDEPMEAEAGSFMFQRASSTPQTFSTSIEDSDEFVEPFSGIIIRPFHHPLEAKHPYHSTSVGFQTTSSGSGASSKEAASGRIPARTVLDKNGHAGADAGAGGEGGIRDETERPHRCPKCGRQFSEWQACHQHVTSRKHGPRCTFPPQALPMCLSHHSLLPVDPHSGWCDLQGRRRYIEDMHAIEFDESHRFFGVFDGHFGTRAARYASRNLHSVFSKLLQPDSANAPTTAMGTSTVGSDTCHDNQEGCGNADAVVDVQRVDCVRDCQGGRPDDSSAMASGMEAADVSCHRMDRINALSGADWRILMQVAPPSDVVFSLDRGGGDVGTLPRAAPVNAWQVASALTKAYLQIHSDVIRSQSHWQGQSQSQSQNPSMANTSNISSDINSDSIPREGSDSATRSDNEAMSPSPTALSPTEGDKSGSTATTLLVFASHIAVANVGDSRVVLCCDRSGLPVQLTVDHTPHDKFEEVAIVARGGWVSKGGSDTTHKSKQQHQGMAGAGAREVPWRVNGVLAVSRSIGDPVMVPALTAEPDVLVIRRRRIEGKVPRVQPFPDDLVVAADIQGNGESPITGGPSMGHTREGKGVGLHCIKYAELVSEAIGSDNMTQKGQGRTGGQLFAVMGSDGLWDVMSNLEATERVCEFFLSEITPTQQQSEQQRVDESDIHTHAGSGNNDRDGWGLGAGDVHHPLLPADSLHKAAELLAHEAWVRGSEDNIGVCVVDLLP